MVVSNEERMRTYVLTVNSYEEARDILKYLRRKRALIHQVVIIASLPPEKRLKVNNSAVLGQKAVVVLVR